MDNTSLTIYDPFANGLEINAPNGFGLEVMNNNYISIFAFHEERDTPEIIECKNTVGRETEKCLNDVAMDLAIKSGVALSSLFVYNAFAPGAGNFISAFMGIKATYEAAVAFNACNREHDENERERCS